MVTHALTVQRTHPARANALWAQADHYLTDQAALIPLWNQIDPGFVSRRVGNYQASPALGVPLLSQLWVRSLSAS